MRNDLQRRANAESIAPAFNPSSRESFILSFIETFVGRPGWFLDHFSIVPVVRYLALFRDQKTKDVVQLVDDRRRTLIT